MEIRRADESVVARLRSVGMRRPSVGLMPLGAGARLLGAAMIVAALWGAFFWATSTPGGS